ncbi:hypothetical protein PspLS_06338 [Pyricularia sp. CBS 133598]|nr:hypothetical protein PspLS_06338 [Pyricularia sp. CBS 133598]
MRPSTLFTALAVAASGAQALAVPREVNAKLAVRALDELHALDPNTVEKKRDVENQKLEENEVGPDKGTAAAPASGKKPALVARFLYETPTSGRKHPGRFRQACSSTLSRLGTAAHKVGDACHKLAFNANGPGQPAGYFNGQHSQYTDPANLQGQSSSHAMATQQHPASQQINGQSGYQQSVNQQQASHPSLYPQTDHQLQQLGNGPSGYQ